MDNNKNIFVELNDMAEFKDFGKAKMTNFEKIKNMSVEEMARRNVYEVEHQKYLTSDESVFEMFFDAVNYEIKWLQSEAEVEDD